MLQIPDLPRHSGPVVVVGSAPSAATFNHSSFHGLRIGIGDMPWRAPEFGPYDYWVTANGQFPLPWNKSHVRAIRRAPVRNLVLATTPFGRFREDEAIARLNQITSSPALPPITLFDHRHQDGALCSPTKGCCAVFSLTERRTIQELFASRARGVTQGYQGSESVAFHGIALAVLLGASPIYLTGIEFPMRRLDYTYYRPLRVAPCESAPATAKYVLGRIKDKVKATFAPANTVFTEVAEDMVVDLNVLGSSARETHQLIVNTSSTSLLNIIPSIETVRGGIIEDSARSRGKKP